MICCILSSFVVLIVIIISAIASAVLKLTKFTKTGGAEQLTVDRALALEYPYCKYFKSINDVNLAFEQIRNFRLKLQPADYTIANMPELTRDQRKFKGDSTIIELSPGDYQSMNWLSDWFNEHCRVKCKRYDESLCPIDYWSANKKSIIDATRPLDYEELNNQLYKKVIGCNNFRPGLMCGFINYFGAKSVLDFSSGWGDRLIGSIAAGVRYVGVDPNECLIDGYKKIIDTFAEDKTSYTMINSPFQQADIGDEKFDLVFTSPPYFDLEIYADAATQSTSEFSNLDDWFEGFLMSSLEKAWKSLNDHGHMVIVINNIRGKDDFVLKMCGRVNEFPQCEYLGLLPYAEKTTRGYKSPQPVWIWKKHPVGLA